MPGLSALDIQAVATALADQIDYDHPWPIDPGTVQVCVCGDLVSGGRARL